MNELPTRVTLQPNGTYIWSAALDADVERKNYKTGGRICIAAAFIIFILGIVFAVRSGSRNVFLYAAAFAVVIVLITFGVVHGQETWPGGYRRTYRLMDELIATGHRRRTALFEFKKAKVMIVGRNYIELQARFGAFRAYLPEEDLNFVRGYIQSRVPMECEIRYE